MDSIYTFLSQVSIICNILVFYFYCLVSLDGKEIHEITREFLRRLEISKERLKMASNETPANPTLSADITGEFWCKFILFVQILTLLNPYIKQFTLHTTLLFRPYQELHSWSDKISNTFHLPWWWTRCNLRWLHNETIHEFYVPTLEGI